MTYAERTITPNEKILSMSKVHWIYLFEGVFWFIILLGLGLYIEHAIQDYAALYALNFDIDMIWISFDQNSTPFPWLFGSAGFLIFWMLFLKYISNEIALTDQRLIFKKNLIFVEILQVDLEDIRGDGVIHGWLGWILGYGRIHLDCRFIQDVKLPAIKDPYEIIKASHTARMRHPMIDYTSQELELNLDEIEERKRKASTNMKLKTLGKVIKASFRCASD